MVILGYVDDRFGMAQLGMVEEDGNLSVRAMVLSDVLPQHVDEGASASCNCA